MWIMPIDFVAFVRVVIIDVVIVAAAAAVVVIVVIAVVVIIVVVFDGNVFVLGSQIGNRPF